MSEEPEREMWQELSELAAAFPEHYSKAKMWLEHAKKHHRPDRVMDALKAARKALDSGQNIVALPRYLDACLKPKGPAPRAGGAKMQMRKWWGEDGSYVGFRRDSIVQGREALLGRKLDEEELHLALHPEQDSISGIPEESKARLRALGVKVKEAWDGLAELGDNRHRSLSGMPAHLLASHLAGQDALDSENPF